MGSYLQDLLTQITSLYVTTKTCYYVTEKISIIIIFNIIVNN